MKPLRSAACAALVCFLLAAGSQPAVSGAREDTLIHVPRRPPAGPNHRAGELLVRFRAGAARTSILGAAGARGHRALRLRGWERVMLAPGTDVEQAASRLRANPAVEAATPNRLYTISSTPDDTYFPLQWGLDNTGQTVDGVGGNPDADIDAPEAWDITQGSSSVVVGVADTGVAYDHPDLAPNMWTNIDEVAGNGLDDDANGKVDDVRGWDFVGNDNDPIDQHSGSHGTHVAGTIGARGFDGYGVTGVSPRVSIMPLRVLGSNGTGNTLDIADAFAYAAANGAKVVNASLGGPEFDSYLYDAIIAAPGTLFIVAAGNDGADNDATPEYPCNFTAANLICVAATTQTDARAGFSNYGKTSVDLGAPGQSIASVYRPTSSAISPSHSLADSPAAYANNSDSWARKSSPLDLSGLSSCVLRYDVRSSVLTGDSLAAERSLDNGASWQPLDTVGSTGGSFVLRSVGLQADGASSVHVRFRFRSDAADTDDGAYIDDVRVVCGVATVWSETFESGLGAWTTGGTNDTWELQSVAGRWAFMDGTSMAAPHVSGAASLLWAEMPAASVGHVKNVLLGSVDALSALGGVTVAGGRLNARRALDYVPDLTAPTGAAIGALPVYQGSTVFGITWSATDTGPAGARKQFEVRQKRARYDGGFTSDEVWRPWTAASGATMYGGAGVTYCFSDRARDGAWNASVYGSARCTALPVDDRTLWASSSWQRKSAPDRYRGTYSYGVTTGARLKLTNVRYKRLSLVVTKCNGCGTVDVYQGSTKLGRFSLNASKRLPMQFVTVKTRTSRSGPVTVTIKIASSGKPVLIEGLAVHAT